MAGLDLPPRALLLGLFFSLALGAYFTDAEGAPGDGPDAVEMTDPLAATIAEASHRFDIPASWINAIIRVESRGDMRAVSPKGAMGLMQIMPQTWGSLRYRYGLGADPFDPRDNILAGSAYLRELYDRYGAPGFLAAYNAGPARYEAYLDNARPLPGETLAYLGALAPLTADDRAADGIVVAVGMRPWSRAPLFVVGAGRPGTAYRPWSALQHGRSSAAVLVNDVTGLAPQSSGLFVSLSPPNARR